MLAVVLTVLGICLPSAKATNWITDGPAEFTSDEDHLSPEVAADRAKNQLENQLGPLKYADGTLVVKTVAVVNGGKDRIAVIVTTNKPEETAELKAKLPTELHGIPVFLNFPWDGKPVVGARFN